METNLKTITMKSIHLHYFLKMQFTSTTETTEITLRQRQTSNSNCRATSSVMQFIKTSKVFLHKTFRLGVDPLGVKKVLIKMTNRYIFQLEKYNTNNNSYVICDNF